MRKESLPLAPLMIETFEELAQLAFLKRASREWRVPLFIPQYLARYPQFQGTDYTVRRFRQLPQKWRFDELFTPLQVFLKETVFGTFKLFMYKINVRWCYGRLRLVRLWANWYVQRFWSSEGRPPKRSFLTILPNCTFWKWSYLSIIKILWIFFT